MKHMEIIQQIESNLQEIVCETVRKGVKGTDISDLNIYFREEYIKVGLEILKGIYESIEEEIYRSKNRK